MADIINRILDAKGILRDSWKNAIHFNSFKDTAMAQNTDSDGETEMLFSGQKTDGGLSGRFENTAVVAGAVISLAWLAFVADYVVSSGWWAARLDMTPAEFSGFAAGILSPFAFIWVAVAYFSSQRRYVKEAGKLRAYISEFMYPNAKNKTYVKALMDDIRSQTADLNAVYDRLRDCADDAKAALGDRIGRLTELAETLERGIDNSARKIQNGVEDLKAASQLADAQSARNAELIENGLNGLQAAARQTDEAYSRLSSALQSDTDALKRTGDGLIDQTARLSAEVMEQSTLLRGAAENARDVLTRQTAAATAALTAQTDALVAAGTQVFDTLDEQAAGIRQNVSGHVEQITRAGQSARDDIAAVALDLELQATMLQTAADTARDNTEKMLSGLERRIATLEEIFDRQNDVISDKDALLTRTSEKLQATFKEQNAQLDQEAEKIVARFRTIETTLDTYINEINAASTTAVEQISTVSDSLNGKADQIVTAGGKACSEMDSAANRIEQGTTRLNDAAMNLKTTAQTVADTMTQQAQDVKSALDGTNDKLSAIQTGLRDGLTEIDAGLTGAEERAETVSRKMIKQAGELSDLTGALVSQAIVTETSLAQQQKYVSNAAAKLEETKSLLKEQADDLTGIADLLDTRAAETVKRLSHLLEDTIGQTGKVVDQIQEIDTVLADKITTLDSSSQRAVVAGNTLREDLERHKSLLDASAQRVAAYAEELGAEITRRTTQMDISSELIKSRSEKAVLQIDEQFRKLTDDAQAMIDATQTAAASLTDSSEKVETLFTRQSATLSAVSDKLAEQSAQVAASLREQSEQADKDLERLVSRIRLIEEGLNVQTKELTNASEMTVSQLETVGTALARQTDALAALTETAKTKMTETGDAATAAAEKLSAAAQDACSRQSESVAVLETKQRDFKQSADELVQRLALLQDEIAEQTDGLQKQSAKSTQQAVMVRDSMQRHIIDLGDVANIVATQSRMGEAALGNQIDYLKEAAEDVMTHIRNINDAVRKNTNDLLAASSRIGFELDAMGENLRQRNDEASKAAEDSLNRSQTAARFLEEKAQLLATMTDQVVNGLNNAGSEFAAQANRIEAAGEIARDQIETTGDTFLVQSHQLTRISEEAQKAVKNLSTVLRERAVDFNKTAENAGAQVRSLNDTVQQIGKEFEEMSNKGVIQIDLAGQRLRSMISEVAGNSERIAVEVRKSGEQFVDQSDLLSIAADDALKRLQELLSVMRDNAKEIQDSGEKISAQSIKLGGAFNRQVQALISASRSAEEYLTALDRKKDDADTERFMREASFIIEKLQSLGVDMARIYTPNVEEDLWKRYYSGDRGAFIRHLSRAIDKNQVRKMTELFTENAEFREYVSRYIAEFDGILARAQENERADVLTGVLLGSEAGRLYMILSRVFNKEA